MVLYNPAVEAFVQMRRTKKKVLAPVGTFEAFARIYYITLPAHLWRGLVSGCLFWLCSWNTVAIKVGFAVFLLSSLATWAQMGATKVKSERRQRALRLFCRGFEIAYRMWVWSLLLVASRSLVSQINSADEAIANRS